MKTISTFDAKNKLSEVIASAERGEPQLITKNGRKAAVVISYSDFERMTASRGTLHDFLFDSPLRGSGLETERSKDVGRKTIDFDSE